MVYKIKHTPTGLYYTPNRYGAGNLSLSGKIYTSRPTRLARSIFVSLSSNAKRPGLKEKALRKAFILPERSGITISIWFNNTFNVKRTEWEIVEFDNLEEAKSSRITATSRPKKEIKPSSLISWLSS